MLNCWEFEREDNFAHVTLACEDGQQVEAHKVTGVSIYNY